MCDKKPPARIRSGTIDPYSEVGRQQWHGEEEINILGLAPMTTEYSDTNLWEIL